MSLAEQTSAALAQIDEVVAQGPFEDTWESLLNYEIPDWYQNEKFGIFIHWGPYCVPAFGNEWYPRRMYLKNEEDPLSFKTIYPPISNMYIAFYKYLC